MPYSSENDPKLPDNVKQLTANKRRQWVAVWNSVFSRCQARNGSDCEAAAFTQASGVIRKGKYDGINFKPPKAVQNAAHRGLELRRKYGRGGLSNEEASRQGVGSGVQRATNLANGNAVSPETIGRMVSFFARHEGNKDSRTDSGEPGAGMIAWLLWGGDPGKRWAEKVKRQMERAEISKAVTVDGLQISLDDLVTAMKLPKGGSTAMLRQAQTKRSEQFGIQILPKASLSIPARLARMGAKPDDFADPVNFRFPVWLSRASDDDLTPTQRKQIAFSESQFKNRIDLYDPQSREAIARRIVEAKKKFGIGYAVKSWDYHIFKQDREKRIATGVVLKASSDENGIRPDGQHDILSPAEVEAAAYKFMIASQRFDLQHKEVLAKGRVHVVESYLAPVDFAANGVQVKRGDWIASVYFEDQTLWEQVKAGKVQAFSIKGKGRRIPVSGQP